MMESRRFKVGRKEEMEVLAEKGSLDVTKEYVESIFNKLRKHNVKIETVLHNCESVDYNRDGVIHADDLIDVIDDLLPRKAISRREYHYFLEALGCGKGKSHNVRYMKIESLHDRFRNTNNDENMEHWYENVPEQEFSGPKGSIGYFLNKIACPAEIHNYRTLIACLEKYERESGMRISVGENGFRIPLGPDLKAAITFNVNEK